MGKRSTCKHSATTRIDPAEFPENVSFVLAVTRGTSHFKDNLIHGNLAQAMDISSLAIRAISYLTEIY